MVESSTSFMILDISIIIWFLCQCLTSYQFLKKNTASPKSTTVPNSLVRDIVCVNTNQFVNITSETQFQKLEDHTTFVLSVGLY